MSILLTDPRGPLFGDIYLKIGKTPFGHPKSKLKLISQATSVQPFVDLLWGRNILLIVLAVHCLQDQIVNQLVKYRGRKLKRVKTPNRGLVSRA